MKTGIDFARLASVAAGALLVLSSCATQPESRTVDLGKNSGDIVVEQGSSAQSKLGLDNAPYVDSDGMLNSTSQGIDSVAFLFDKNGVLAKPPVYISDFGLNAVNDFYVSRFRGLTVGRSTRANVETLFGPLTTDRRSPEIGYIRIVTYNPFSHNSSSTSH
jgi:hypothetical protein